MLRWNASWKNHKIIFWGLITNLFQESGNGRDPVGNFRKIPTIIPGMESQLSECSFSSRFNNPANSVKEEQTLFPLFIGNRSIGIKLKVNITTRFPWEGSRWDPIPFWEVMLKGFNIMMERKISNRNEWLFVTTILWRRRPGSRNFCRGLPYKCSNFGQPNLPLRNTTLPNVPIIEVRKTRQAKGFFSCSICLSVPNQVNSRGAILSVIKSSLRCSNLWAGHHLSSNGLLEKAVRRV